MTDQSSNSGFSSTRKQLNDLVMAYAGTNIKRFYNLDEAVYQEGNLSSKHKELIGLVASLVLRCDDCVTYHLTRCHELEVSDAELEEALSIGLIVGGSIVIPHLRRAIKTWDDFK